MYPDDFEKLESICVSCPIWDVCNSIGSSTCVLSDYLDVAFDVTDDNPHNYTITFPL